MEPLNHLMAVTQSQNFQRTEPSQTVRQAQQQNQVADQQHRVQETVTSIPEETNDSQEMMALRGGLGGGAEEGHGSSKDPKDKDKEAPDKALLQEGSGERLDIIG